MKHPIVPPKAETLEELGQKIGQLRYDACVVVLSALADEVARQAKEDKQQGKMVLAGFGSELEMRLQFATSLVIEMLHVSRQYLEDEINANPLP